MSIFVGRAMMPCNVSYGITEGTTNQGSYRPQLLNTAGVGNMNLIVPADVNTILSLDLVGFNVSATPGAADIDMISQYGNVDLGEASNFHSTTDTTSTWPVPAVNAYFAWDLSGMFPLLAAGDSCGLEVDHQTIGGEIAYIGMRLRYT